MTPYDQAQRWLAKQPPAVSGQGGHNQTFAVACALVHGFALGQADAHSLLTEYSARCQPPWSQREVEHKLADALRAPSDKPRGYLLHVGRSHTPRTQKDRPVSKSAARPVDGVKLPDPIPDGARQLLRAVFAPGEGVRVANAKLNEDNHEIPADAGVVLSREEWLRKLDAKDGNPNGIWSSTKKTGIYITINPMRAGGSKDSDVTAFRHALIEFDTISREEQWNLYQQSKLPCAAVISSGGKSIHAWVKVDARDRKEYDDRVRILYKHFESAGYALDTKNRNPSRFSRLPNCVRFNSRQELLALNTGCESWSEWQAQVQADGIGETVSVDTLLDFNPKEDPNSVLGNRWLCCGGSCLLIGPSGVGKSSLAAQLAATWAIGKPAFGIDPHVPLKSLIIQAENDVGDLAEMIQGVFAGFSLLNDVEDELFRRNLIFVRDTTHTGWAFTEAVRRLIDRHKPDLVWFDPLLSFIGADISKQEVCSEFLRNWLNPISEATGVVWMCVHHTGKPPSDAKARKGWTTSDRSYLGLGSSDIVNWARAAMVLRQINDRQFELEFSKRGKRAGAKHPSGEPTVSVWLQHATEGIRWEQIDPPQEPVANDMEKKPVGQPSKVRQIAAMNLHEVLSAIPPDGESAKSLGKRLQEFGQKHGVTLGETKARTDLIDMLVQNQKLAFDTTLKAYKKGPNA